MQQHLEASQKQTKSILQFEFLNDDTFRAQSVPTKASLNA